MPVGFNQKNMSKKQNRIYTTIPPLYNRLVKAEAEYKGQTESSIVSDAVKQKYDAMSFEQKKELLKALD